MTAPVLLPVRIAGTAAPIPGEAIATATLTARVEPPLDAERIVARSGIASRYQAPSDATCASLGAAALAAALADAELPATALSRLIFVNSLGGDELIPATANAVAAALGLAGTCDCFDVNNACMGFLTAFDLAARSIATGMGPIGIVVTERGTRFIAPEDPRPFVVFGDATVAAVLTPTTDGGGVRGVWLRNDGVARGNVALAHAGLTGKRETIRFTASNRQMGGEAIDAVRTAAAAVLAQAGLAIGDVDWILPHQPNGALLAAITDALGVPPERIVPIVHEYGSVGAAAIPLSLARLRASGRATPGARLLMVGVGAGISSGAILHEVGR